MEHHALISHSIPSCLPMTYKVCRFRLGSRTARTSSRRADGPSPLNCDLVFISLMKSIVYNHCLSFLLHMSSCIRNCLNLLRKNIIKNLSGILRFFLAASAKFRQSKPKGFSFLNSRNHLKNNSQTSSKTNLNSF